MQFEHMVNERLCLVGKARKEPATVTKKMANMTTLIAKIHAGVVLEPLGSYILEDSNPADHAAFTEILSSSKARTEQFREDTLKELSSTLLPNLRENPPSEMTISNVKKEERRKIRQVR